MYSYMQDISKAPLQVHYYSEVLPTTAFILCRSYHAKALHETVSERLAQGPNVAARVGFEPATFRTQGTEPTTEPPPSVCIYALVCRKCILLLIVMMFSMFINRPISLSLQHLFFLKIIQTQVNES